MNLKTFAVLAMSLATICASAATAFAQRDERVIVTASRIDRDGGDLPVVSIRVPAEYVIFLLEVETATRSEDERARELQEAYAAIIARVKGARGMTLEAGDAWSSSPIETVAVKEIIHPDDEDELRSEIDLVLTVAVRAGDTFDSIRARTEQFVSQIPQTGRVEIVMGDTQFMGVDDPKKHRETLLRQIAADTDLLQSLFGGKPTGPASISLNGLEGRVKSRPVGPLELEIYIDYSLSLVQAPRN